MHGIYAQMVESLAYTLRSLTFETQNSEVREAFLGTRLYLYDEAKKTLPKSKAVLTTLVMSRGR